MLKILSCNVLSAAVFEIHFTWLSYSRKMASTVSHEVFPVSLDHGRTDRAEEPLARGKTRNAISPCVSIRFKHAGSMHVPRKNCVADKLAGKTRFIVLIRPALLQRLSISRSSRRCEFRCNAERRDGTFQNFPSLSPSSNSRREVFTDFFSYIVQFERLPLCFKLSEFSFTGIQCFYLVLLLVFAIFILLVISRTFKALKNRFLSFFFFFFYIFSKYMLSKMSM